MNPIERFHAWLTDHGISPKVADPFLLGLLAVVVTWAIGGEFDLDQVRLLVVTFVYGALGVAAPAAAKLSFKDVQVGSKRARRRKPT